MIYDIYTVHTGHIFAHSSHHLMAMALRFGKGKGGLVSWGGLKKLWSITELTLKKIQSNGLFGETG